MKSPQKIEVIEMVGRFLIEAGGVIMSIIRVGSLSKGDRMAFGPKHMKAERREARTHVTVSYPNLNTNSKI